MFQRFTPIKKTLPAPGTYNDPRNAFDLMKRTTGLKRSPFGQTSVRFNPEPHVKKTPGIIFHSLAIKLEYKKIDVPEMLMENLRKQIFFSRIYIVEI